VDLVNDHVSRNFHPTGGARGHPRLVIDQLSTADNSSFHLSKMVCRALQTRGYHVLIGPSDPSLRNEKITRNKQTLTSTGKDNQH
jgi:hypothetical protein